MEPAACESSPDTQHLWARRRDGKWCVWCFMKRFGSSELTEDEHRRIEQDQQRLMRDDAGDST